MARPQQHRGEGSRCERCGEVLVVGLWHIDVKAERTGKWRRLIVERRGYVEGLWAGLTDYTRIGDEMALVDHAGNVFIHHKGGGGLQVGMVTTPHRKRYARLASRVMTGAELVQRFFPMPPFGDGEGATGHVVGPDEEFIILAFPRYGDKP